MYNMRRENKSADPKLCMSTNNNRIEIGNKIKLILNSLGIKALIIGKRDL